LDYSISIAYIPLRSKLSISKSIKQMAESTGMIKGIDPRNKGGRKIVFFPDHDVMHNL